MENEKFLEQIKDKFFDSCPICHSKDFNLMDCNYKIIADVFSTIKGNNGLTIGMNALEAKLVICNNCKYIMLFKEA